MTPGDVDKAWLIFGAVLVIFMQAGFTMLEVGSVAAKNTKNILTKNLMDICLGAICWYFVGYGFAFGEDTGDGWIGDSNFGGTGEGFTVQRLNEDGSLPTTAPFENGAWWVFQFSFCATAATIVSGAVAERMDLRAYFVMTIFLTAFVYPIVVHWAWTFPETQDDGNITGPGGVGKPGWATQIEADGNTVGVIDFAGSGVVHMTGGMAALVGAALLGPRRGRFEAGDSNDWSGQNHALQTLGTLILWVGWYGFNCVSTGGIDGQGLNAGRIAMTTTISAATAGATTMMLGRVFSGAWNPAYCNNGILSGLVAITAGCANVEAYGAFWIGFLAAPIYLGSSKLLEKLKIDDVIDASPVHLFCGIWGVLAPGFFGAGSFSDGSGSCGVFYKDANYRFANGTESHVKFRDCGDTQGSQLAAQIAFVVAVITWVGLCSLLMFGLLKAIGILRVSAEDEEQGLDATEHGGGAYSGAARKHDDESPTPAKDVEAALEEA